MFTRKDYMSKECTHQEYYSQFITGRTRAWIYSAIGLERLQNSTDEHLNDIPLSLWDTAPFPNGSKVTASGDFVSQSTIVCVAKACARQLIEGAKS